MNRPSTVNACRLIRPFALALLLAGGVGAPASAAGSGPAPDADGYTYGPIAGNAFDLLPEPEDGRLSVVAMGPAAVAPFGWVGFVVTNGTDEPVADITLTTEAQDETGQSVTLFGLGVMQPPVLEPGGTGLMVMAALTDSEEFLSEDATSSDFLTPIPLTVETGLTSVPADEAESGFLTFDSPTVTALVTDDTGITATVRNDGDAPLEGLTLDTVCFDDEGAVTQAGTTVAAADALAPGAETTITLSFGQGGVEPATGCDRFLVAGNGIVVPGE